MPSNPVNKLAAMILTIAGLIALPIDIYHWSHSIYIGVGSAALLIILLGGRAAHFFIPTRVQRQFGVRRHRTHVTLAHSAERVTIDSNFRATIDTKQTLIFRDTPHPDDLVDIIDVLPHETIEDACYSSPDSIIVDVVKKTPSTLAIRWKSKKEIEPNALHVHRTKYRVPSLYGDDGFFQAMYIDRITGKKEWDFYCSHSVEKVLAFIMPRHRHRVTEAYLYRRVVSGKERNCEQPIIDQDGHRIRWVITQPLKGRTYVLFAIYRGMYPRITEQAASYSFSSRLKRYFGYPINAA